MPMLPMPTCLRRLVGVRLQPGNKTFRIVPGRDCLATMSDGMVESARLARSPSARRTSVYTAALLTCIKGREPVVAIGAARATGPTPMLPFAPVTFSMMTV